MDTFLWGESYCFEVDRDFGERNVVDKGLALPALLRLLGVFYWVAEAAA